MTLKGNLLVISILVAIMIIDIDMNMDQKLVFTITSAIENALFVGPKLDKKSGYFSINFNAHKISINVRNL